MKNSLMHVRHKKRSNQGNTLISVIIGLALSLLVGNFIAEGMSRGNRGSEIYRHNDSLEQTRNALRRRINCAATVANFPTACATGTTYAGLWVGKTPAELIAAGSSGTNFGMETLRAKCVANSKQLSIEYLEKYAVATGAQKALGAEERSATGTWLSLFSVPIACDK